MGNSVRFQTRGPALSSILKDVAEVFNVPVELVKTKLRRGPYVDVRRLYAYVSVLLTDAPLKHIGELINTDHTMVIYYKDKIKEWLEIGDPSFRLEWEKYRNASKIWFCYKQQQSL